VPPLDSPAIPTARPYPFAALPRLSRGDAAAQSVLASWLAARPSRDKLAALAGGPVRVRFGARAPRDDSRAASEASSTSSQVPRARGALDPFAARCELRIAGATIDAFGSSRAIRTLAQRLLGGPAELDAPRPLTQVEQSLWALVVATAVDDLAIAAEVIPRIDTVTDAPSSAARRPDVRRHDGQPADGGQLASARALVIALDLVLGDLPLAVELHAPALGLRAPPSRPLPTWAGTTMIDCPIVVGRCALPVDAIRQLAVRDIVTLDRPLAGHPDASGRRADAELVIFGGAVGLRAAPNAVSAAVGTGYVRRDMSLPDDAHVELTVALGTTQLSLRQVVELAVGQIIQLGRPLAGPFELRAAGRIVGRGELVDVDGELGVRIVSLESDKTP
jgi:flagellar motor switch/type III secretory pathway protein FliN